MNIKFKPKLPWRYTVPFIAVWIVIAVLTQALIGTFPVPECGIGDALQNLTKPIDFFFSDHLYGANAILIISSIFFDFAIFFLIFRSIFGSTVRPFMELFIFLLLRQTLQFLVSLPLPEHIIWHYPGLPAFFVRYGISNDLYFSAHTGISLLFAMELSKFNKRWLTIAGYAIFIFMVILVISFQIHYTMDVYTALLTVYFVAHVSKKWAPKVDEFLIDLGRKKKR